MGERLLCKQEVVGSIPITSTSASGAGVGPESDDNAIGPPLPGTTCFRPVL